VGLVALRKEASTCERCDLYRSATQTVFGEGDPGAQLVLIGEQPGDREDVEGRPFVGPAGHLLDRVLGAAGIERRELYLTNAVKHFKWKRQGKVRLHQKPNLEEVLACEVWWRHELEEVAPELVVLLGATAAQAALGPKVRVMRDRGVVIPAGSVPAPRGRDPFPYDALVTVHPSAVLRMREPERDEAFLALVRDLEEAARHAGIA
jgi:uracil-DNA glycosylase